MRSGLRIRTRTAAACSRLAFLFHKKLNDKPMAVKYFKEYLKRYPYSGQAVVARRFLEDLGEGGAEK